MLDPSSIATLSMHCVFFLAGLTGNVFILVVNFLDWLKRRSLSPCDQIISSLGFFNIIFQGTVVANEFCIRIWKDYYFQDSVVMKFVSIQIFVFFSSLWCCTFLCFYYCVKIINSTSSFVFLVKTNIPKIVPWFIITFVLISLGTSLPIFWELYKEFSPVPANFSGNGTIYTSFVFKSKCNCLFRVYLGFSSVAFTVFSLLAVSILVSLLRHMWRVGRHSDGFNGKRLAAHLSATRTVTSLLLLYISFYIAFNFVFSSPTAVGTLFFSLSMLMISSFPTLNALILIMGNTKLKNMLQRLFLGTSGKNSNEEGNIESNRRVISSIAC